MTLSMSAVGHCYDNAMQESFWGHSRLDVLTARFRHAQRLARGSSSTWKSGTTVSGGILPWAISALLASSRLPAPDILTVHYKSG